MRRTVDACVGVKWVVAEDGWEKAAKLLEQPAAEMVAPPLFRVEVAGALRKKVALGLLDAHDALFDLGRLLRAPVEVIDAAKLPLRAFEISLALDHDIDDCFYLALAIAEEAPLVTADCELVRKAREFGLGDHVIALEEVA